MKASLKIEAIGDNVDQEMRLWRNIINMSAPGLGDITIGKPIYSYWVAQISGHDPKYKYARQFIRGKKDYTLANSKGSRGVFIYYLLESGFVYEVKSSKRRYFCVVDEEGNIIEVGKEFVDQWIKDHSESVLMMQPGKE